MTIVYTADPGVQDSNSSFKSHCIPCREKKINLNDKIYHFLSKAFLKATSVYIASPELHSCLAISSAKETGQCNFSF
jgi:hypothetical protein